jgi:hypothetical protein
MIQITHKEWAPVLMLKLRHSKLFDQDPYGDVMDCTAIGTIGASIMMVFYMLFPLPKSDMSLLYISMFVALGLGICSIPIYYTTPICQTTFSKFLFP